MKIYTRIVLDMTQDDLPVIESESYEYDGNVAMCWGGKGGGADSEAGGDAGRGDGRNGGGSGSSGGGGKGNGSDGNNGQGVGGHRGGGRGDGNNANGKGNSADGGRGNGSEGSNISGRSSMSSNRGFGGSYNGIGVGNRTATRGGMSMENALGGLAQAKGINTGGNIGKWSGRVAGAVFGPPGAGFVGGVIGEKAGAAIGGAIGAAQDDAALGGKPSSKSTASATNERNGGNEILEALTANLDMNNPVHKALVDSISPKDTGPKPTMTAEQLKSNSNTQSGVSAEDVFANRTTGARV